jgi:proteasome lid subunit RPN8/RPN11
MDPQWPPASRRRGFGAGLNTNTALMETPEPSPSHFIWEVANKPIAIHLEFDVVDRMAMEVMRGFGAVPRRGAEVGGVLLGTIELAGKLIVRVEDFVPVPCDYRRGPSYLLTEQDTTRFRETVEQFRQAPDQRLSVVGFYRSHTRDGLSLTDEDVQMFTEYFGDPSHVILLVRPFATKTSVGGFFFEENGTLRRESSYLEFPFRRKDLGGGASPNARREATETPEAEAPKPMAVAAAEAPSAPAPAETTDAIPDLREIYRARAQQAAYDAEASNAAKFRGKWVWIPLSFVFLLLGVIIGFQAALVLNKGDAQKVAAQSLLLSLSAQKDGGKLVVRWDRRSAAVQNARSGKLLIKDGEFDHVVNLDPRQLQNGSVIYMSTDSKVDLRLEVATHERGAIVETAEFVPGAK